MESKDSAQFSFYSSPSNLLTQWHTHPAKTSLDARAVNCRMPLDLPHGQEQEGVSGQAVT